MNLFIHGYNGQIEREDSLGAPQFTENGRLEAFDYVPANFPFSADWPKSDLPRPSPTGEKSGAYSGTGWTGCKTSSLHRSRKFRRFCGVCRCSEVLRRL